MRGDDDGGTSSAYGRCHLIRTGGSGEAAVTTCENQRTDYEPVHSLCCPACVLPMPTQLPARPSARSLDASCPTHIHLVPPLARCSEEAGRGSNPSSSSETGPHGPCFGSLLNGGVRRVKPVDMIAVSAAMWLRIQARTSALLLSYVFPQQCLIFARCHLIRTFVSHPLHDST